MSKKQNFAQNWQTMLREFSKSKSFLPTVIGLAAVLILVIALVVGAVTGGHDVPAAADDESKEWSEPAEDGSYDASGNKVDETALKFTVLPETEDAGQEYLDETLFLGDSNTQRYMYYGPDSDSKQHYTTTDNNIGVVSMGVSAITSLKWEQFVGKTVTMPQAVQIMQPRRIIIGFGTNNLTMKTETFIENYKKGLKAIHEAYPYADIIVNAIPPLDKQRENTRLTMTDVDRLNSAIAKMCEEEGYKYLDSSKALEDPETGWAKKDYTIGDGVHLSRNGVKAFFDYVRTHAHITEDTRPMPLKKIPKIKGVTPGLISQDPIAVRGARVPVEIIAGEGGRIEGKTKQAVKKGQQTEIVRAVANEGWTFKGWTASIGSVEQKESIRFTVPGNADANGVVLTAQFTRVEPEETEEPEPTPEPTKEPAKKISVSFSAGEGGTVKGTVSQPLAAGETASPVEAVADPGWVFEHWVVSAGNGSKDARLSYTVPADWTGGDIQLTAKFRKAETTTPTPPADTPAPPPANTPAPPADTPAPPADTPVPACSICGQQGHTADGCPNKCPECGGNKLDGHTHQPAPAEPQPPVEPQPPAEPQAPAEPQTPAEPAPAPEANAPAAGGEAAA